MAIEQPDGTSPATPGRGQDLDAKASQGGSSANGNSARLGGAAADFVASLGRKLEGAKDALQSLEDDPTNTRARDDLRRRLHALGAGARLLRFEAMARSLGDAEIVLERATRAGKLRKEDFDFLSAMVDDLPSTAWGESPTREPPRAETSEPPPPVSPAPFAALVVGDGSLVEGLQSDASGGRSFECERTEDVQAAVDIARAYAPDVVIVDADLDDAPELVEALLDDPLTEPVPLIVVGNITSDRAARFVALGVAKLLPKPVLPETIRRACEEILEQRDGRTMRLTLGEPTLEQLGNRLAEEVRRAIVDSVDRGARGVRVPLGEGTEVMGALWGAIARVQEVITAKTEGGVRFGTGGAPEGAIALAPWLHQDLPGADRMRGRGRGAADDVRLDKRRVVVADDDPGVTWFIADLLRTAGCEVHEALDGATALELSFKVSPELVVSDILMPGLDGFALCRALKRDVALRDTPVILLSWKEDLLQRVRELGASAAAYLKKESDARAILARVREVMRPRARIEARLRGKDEVRGRLDGLTVRLLLELACTLRPEGTRVAVRDASFLYEVDIENGAPTNAKRTAPDGVSQRGESVLARMLGASAGRFVVSALGEGDGAAEELFGTLAEQLGQPIARARGALFATTGARTMNVEGIGIDAIGLEDYLRATPDPARSVIQRIARGASPRQMLLRGEVAPTLLEDVLADLASRGAIVDVRGANGVDLLKPAIDSAFAAYEGRAPVRRSTLPPPPRSSLTAPPRPVTSSPPRVEPSFASVAPPIAAAKPMSVAPSKAFTALDADRASPKYESLTMSDPPPPMPVATETEPPSSLEDAVMRELSDRSPALDSSSHAGAGAVALASLPPIVEPSDLRPRSSNPPSLPELAAFAHAEDRDAPIMPSIPPDAIVPGASVEEALVAPPAPLPSAAALPAPRPSAPALLAVNTPDPMRMIVELTEATEIDAPIELTQKRELSMPLMGARRELSMPVFVSAGTLEKAKKGESVSLEEPNRTPLSSVKVAAESLPPIPKRKWSSTLRLGGLALLAVAVGLGLRWSMPDKDAASTASPPPRAASQLPAPGTISAPSGPVLGASPGSVVTSPPALTAPSADDAAFLDIPAGVSVPDGQGYFSLTAAPDALIRIDGAQKGRGPKLGVALAKGFHDVRVGPPSREKVKLIEVRAGKETVADMTQ